MNAIKKVFKILLIILLFIIPTCLILYSMFIDFLGCYLLINNNAKIDELLKKEGYNKAKIIFVDTTAGDDEHISIINENFSFEDDWISTDYNELVEYAKTNGIDVYNCVNVINYAYIIILAIAIFFKKLLENVEKYGKFQERDN